MNGKAARLFVSRRTILPDGVKPAIIVVTDGVIEEIIRCSSENEINQVKRRYIDVDCNDFGNLILMPGVVDSHVHVNEPGRTEWEGFWTATRAAAAGGVTTLVDMPLNSIPPTTTVENLKTKVRAAKNQSFVDVGFWGGVIPGNHLNLKPLVEAGVVGFKCFLCPSGVDEFPHVDENDVRAALSELQYTNSLLAFHAECEVGNTFEQIKGNPCNYETYLQTRPPEMETNAITMIMNMCETYQCRCHIVHLSAGKALNLIRQAKQKQLPLTVETCYHYLCLAAETIPNCATQFKCCPPIRDETNQEKLWMGIEDGSVDMVVSDHSPSSADLKAGGDFLKAWGGISSLQFGLSLLWTGIKNRPTTNLGLVDVARLLCAAPAQLCGLQDRKGSLRPGMHADFVVWDPDSSFQVQEREILHKHKLTPYKGDRLFGKVLATIVRGDFVYKHGEFCAEPFGQPLLAQPFLASLLDF
ncbi:hypothetical protein QAD02_023199 [Eretmocerus hayati]|uniref:Uncharacterized protein n=1 Tax=Eretmocerus hayati TaxID=131215 RepID=A0ACC2Q027_9HYME|nr:hypothetical protein QAD02_023199 [Eretmocerus hayati]